MQPIAEKTKCLLISHMIRHLTDPKFLEFLTKYMYPVHILLPNNIYVIIYLNKLKAPSTVGKCFADSLLVHWLGIHHNLHTFLHLEWEVPLPAMTPASWQRLLAVPHW